MHWNPWICSQDINWKQYFDINTVQTTFNKTFRPNRCSWFFRSKEIHWYCCHFYKNSSGICKSSLLKIMNISPYSSLFPSAFKIAKIIRIHKGGSKHDPSNYTPISILSVLSKILEKGVTKHLFADLSEYALLHKSQSGFSKKITHVTQLLFNLVDKWLSSIDKWELVGAIFYDLKRLLM